MSYILILYRDEQKWDEPKGPVKTCIGPFDSWGQASNAGQAQWEGGNEYDVRRLEEVAE